ncbi:uncharacterized protein LOC126236647 [Schistocerca nitens]|uniref:uncharacterized protein LOC126236647 n=1 Tax=Schistocerca nitens TaxID=7011 RepID=UPI002119A11C|nr:uncharacterized protein LOC126236647 [Schistocerca nitens]XP_049852123.1 uncharacterized protein LOC126329551 isoform X1 [Schistocerca gregaria]
MFTEEKHPFESEKNCRDYRVAWKARSLKHVANSLQNKCKQINNIKKCVLRRIWKYLSEFSRSVPDDVLLGTATDVAYFKFLTDEEKRLVAAVKQKQLEDSANLLFDAFATM